MEYEGVQVGQCVTYVDPHAIEHDALITAVWGWNSKLEQDENYRETFELQKDTEWATEEWLASCLAMEWKPPSLNLVFVSSDKTQTDPYGRQLAQRATSIVHASNQGAYGNYWKNKEK